jgi:hypothetical protein
MIYNLYGEYFMCRKVAIIPIAKSAKTAKNDLTKSSLLFQSSLPFFVYLSLNLPSIFLQRYHSVRSCLDYFVAGFEGIFVDFKYIFFGFIGVVYLA